MNAAIVPPPPGVMPSNVPISVPIACGWNIRFQIAQPGSRSRVSRASVLSQAGVVTWIINSLTANNPTITRIGRIPPADRRRRT